MARSFDTWVMNRLRVAATLAAVAPVRVRVGDGERTVLEVRRPPLPQCPGHTVVPPCWFRSMVVDSLRGLAPGSGTIMASLTDINIVTVDVALAHPGMTLPGGIWRIDHQHSWAYLFTTTLGIDATRSAAAEGRPDIAVDTSVGDSLQVGFFEDEATGVTLVCTSGPVGDERSAAHYLEVVHTMLVPCATAELCSELEQRTAGGAEGRR